MNHSNLNRQLHTSGKLGDLLQSEAYKYENFIKHPEVKRMHNEGSIKGFFAFLSNIYLKHDILEHKKILEHPNEFGYNSQYGSSESLFKIFLDTYATFVGYENKTRFDNYQDIILQAHISNWKFSNQELVQNLGGDYFETYNALAIKYGIVDIVDQRINIAAVIGTTTELGKESITIENLIDLGEGNIDIITNLHLKFVVPYLQNNPYICQDIIFYTEKLYNKFGRLNEDYENTYHQIINIMRTNTSVCIKYDQGNEFGRPISNGQEYMICLHRLLDYINKYRWGKCVYIESPNAKLSHINNLKLTITDSQGNETSPMQCIDLVVNTLDNEKQNGIKDYDEEDYDEEDYDEEDYDEEDYDEEDYINNNHSDIFDEQNGDEIKNSDQSEHHNPRELTYLIKKELSHYYQIDIELGYDHDHDFITFTLKLNYYKNNIELLNSSIIPSPLKSICIHPTFGLDYIGNKTESEYYQLIVQLLNNLSLTRNRKDLFPDM